MIYLWQGKKFCWELPPSHEMHGHLEFHLPLSLSLGLLMLELISFLCFGNAFVSQFHPVFKCPTLSQNKYYGKKCIGKEKSLVDGRQSRIWETWTHALPCSQSPCIPVGKPLLTSCVLKVQKIFSKIRTYFGAFCNSHYWLLNTEVSS